MIFFVQGKWCGFEVKHIIFNKIKHKLLGMFKKKKKIYRNFKPLSDRQNAPFGATDQSLKFMPNIYNLYKNEISLF